MPCENLESRALSDAAFPEFAKKVVLFLHNTSRVDGEPYPTLLQDKGFTGFPTLCFMDAEGSVLLKQGYEAEQQSVPGFEKSLGQAIEKGARRKELTAKAKAGDVAAQKELFLEDLRLGQLNAEQIKDGAKKITLSKEEQAQVDETLADLEIRTIQRTHRGDTARINEQIAALAKAGKRPSKAGTVNFWTMALTHAATAKDVKLAEQAFGELEKASEGKAPERSKDRWKKLLEEAKDQGQENPQEKPKEQAK